MIQIVEGLPDNVVGIVAQGRVTAADCDKILKPVMETSLKRHDKVRLSMNFPKSSERVVTYGQVTTARRIE